MTIRNCEVNGWCQGILTQGEDGLIEYNKSFDNYTGTHLHYADRNDVVSNKSDDNLYGIRIRGSDENYVLNNTIHGSGLDGIYCQNFAQLNISAENVIDHNQINRNGDNAIDLLACDDNTVTYNTGNRNGGHGIYIRSGSNENDVEKKHCKPKRW